MSIRTFLFCDVCNPRGIRCPEQRRDMRRRDFMGRRITDARSWFEGDLTQAIEEGNWAAVEGGFYYCPSCVIKGLTVDNPNRETTRGLQSFIFCDLCNPQGVRFVELRRNENRFAKIGRRITDGRSWMSPATVEALLEQNWMASEDEQHYCQSCRKLHPSTLSGGSVPQG